MPRGLGYFGLATLKLQTTTTTKQAEPSTASDIWAFWVVFFELASREVPFEIESESYQGIELIKECEQIAPIAEAMRRCCTERSA